MNRGDFQQLAEEHLRHAKALLDARLYSGAYYMCGYVVECALKACICAQTNQFDFYPHPQQARDAWSHEFDKLVGLSGLKPRDDLKIVSPDTLLYKMVKQRSALRLGPVPEGLVTDAYIYKMT